MARGINGVGIALSSRAEAALLDWIPVNSRLCAVRLDCNFKVNSGRRSNRCLFVVSAYAPTNCSSEAEKDDFYRDLSRLLRSARSSDIVILAGDMNAQVGRLSSTESHLGGRFSVDAERTDNGERLLQLCADHNLFLVSTSFQHKRIQRVTWRPPRPDQRWTQLDHIAISHRWRASVQDCRSFWQTPLDSDHALVRTRISIRFPASGMMRSNHVSVRQLNSGEVAQRYRMKLAQQLKENATNDDQLEDDWKNIKGAIVSAFQETCSDATTRSSDHWISSRTTTLIEARKSIPPDNSHDVTRRTLKRRIIRSLREDRERWWKEKAKAMENVYAFGNSFIG